MRLKTTISIAFFFIFFFEGQSQIHGSYGLVTEFGVMGNLSGIYGGVQIKSFGVGIFYEDTPYRDQSEYNPKVQIIGAYGSWRFIQEGKLSSSVLLRAGVKDNQFVLIVPSLLFSYQLGKQVHLGVIAGFRAEYPSVGLALNFTFPIKE